jgi:hypothetical protein
MCTEPHLDNETQIVKRMKRYTKVMIAAIEGSTISGGRNLWIENGFRGTQTRHLSRLNNPFHPRC